MPKNHHAQSSLLKHNNLAGFSIHIIASTFLSLPFSTDFHYFYYNVPFPRVASHKIIENNIPFSFFRSKSAMEIMYLIRIPIRFFTRIKMETGRRVGFFRRAWTLNIRFFFNPFFIFKIQFFILCFIWYMWKSIRTYIFNGVHWLYIWCLGEWYDYVLFQANPFRLTKF